MNKYFKSALTTILIGSIALLSACTLAGKTQNANQGSDSGKSEKKEQVFYITQRLGTGANNSIEPVAGQHNGRFITQILYRPLIKFDPTSSELKPDIADSWEVSNDELTYSLKIKKGLKWSDNHDLTVEDVVFTIQTLLKASIVDGIFPENFLKIEGAKDYKDGKTENIKGLTVSDNQLTIKLQEKTGQFINILAQTIVLPKHKLKDADPLKIHNNEFWQNPISSGMFKVKEINPGNYIEFVQNENYEGIKPKITKIISTFINDPVIAMQDEKTYFYTATKLNEIEQLSQLQGVTQYPVDVMYYRYFILNLSGNKGQGNSLIADKKVREALLYAIDREKLAKTIYKGTVKLNHTGVPSMAPEYYQQAQSYQYNPEKAKQLLQEAGFDFNRILKITHYHTDQVTTNLIAAIAQQLKEIGIKVETFAITSNASTMLYQTRDYDIALAGLASFAYENWYGHYSSKSPTFGVLLNHDTSFDSLINKLAASSDPKERLSILKDLQILEQDKLFKLPLFTSEAYNYVNTNKVAIPEGLKFGNPWYYNDLHFEKWTIKD